MCCQVRILFGIGTKRFQMTRLGTRTKESTHVCEYVPKNGMCGMKVKVLICVCRNNRLQFSERGLSTRHRDRRGRRPQALAEATDDDRGVLT